MLTKKYEHIEQNEFATLFSQDVVCQGTIEAQDSILIKGNFEESTLKGTLVVVSQEGDVQGKVNAEYLAISGIVSGKISVSESLHVLKDGEVKGSVSTTSLVVDEGGLVNANCHMIAKTPEREEKTNSQDKASQNKGQEKE